MTRVDGPMCGATAASGADRHDPPVAHGERARPRAGGVHGRDAATGQDEVGGSVDGHRVSWLDAVATAWHGASESRTAGHAARAHPAARDGLPSPTMTTVHLLHAGYNGDRVGSSITLVRDGDALIVVDPGLVARRSQILDPLRELGVAPEAVTHVFVSHHHPDHTINIALFPNAGSSTSTRATRTTCGSTTPGDGYELARTASCGLTPGHTDRDASLIVEADDASYAHDPPVVARRPDAGARSVFDRPGGARGQPRAGPGGRRHRHPRARRPVPVRD